MSNRVINPLKQSPPSYMPEALFLMFPLFLYNRDYFFWRADRPKTEIKEIYGILKHTYCNIVPLIYLISFAIYWGHVGIYIITKFTETLIQIYISNYLRAIKPVNKSRNIKSKSPQTPNFRFYFANLSPSPFNM